MSHFLTDYIFRHFPYDNIQERRPWLTFQFPSDYGNFQLGLVPLDIGFWIVAFVLLSAQTAFNALVALITYEFLLPTTNKSHTRHRFILGYGLVVPALIFGPCWILHTYWSIPNVACMLAAFGAVPIVLLLRVVEAMHGKLPEYCRTSRSMTCLYFSSTLLLAVDKDGRSPVPLTREVFWAKFRSFSSVLLQSGALFSILLANEYEVFPSNKQQLWHLGNLANAFLMASVTSLMLDGGASGLGLMMSCATGCVYENFHDAPLSQATSPSDFWGRRWDRPVQSALKRGCYMPLRDQFSSGVAAVCTFLVSGLMHEYIIHFFSLRGGYNPRANQYRHGRQFVFFLWNGIVLILERYWKEWTKGVSIKMPRRLQTALVVLTVLPIGHFFTDEYIRTSAYDDSSWGFPLLVVSRQ